MATIMSGLGFQEMMASLGSPSNDSSGAQRKISRSETIHSGHFMVSEIEDSEQTVEQQSNEPSHESDYERPSESTDPLIGYDLETNCKETMQTYVYGPEPSNTVSIDGSLTKLFECMSLAYSGKITSPRWKTFKGLKLKLKDKIRLNNIIWRAWHIQYIAGRNPIVCQFSSPVDSDRHKKVEAVILEGKYWKRRLATVTAEYKKWRLYHRKVGRPQTPSRPSSFDWENWTTSFNSSDMTDDYSMDFTDSLFSQLLQPNLIDFPNPREIARSGMGAEFMQPGLVQLQPNLDDFMDTFEPLQEFYFTSKNMSSLPTLPEETNVENSGQNVGVEQQNSKLNQNIPEISTPDLLNSLLCSTTTANSSPIQSFSVNNKTLSESMVQNRRQMSPELQLMYKPNSMQAMQPSIQSLSLSAPAIQSMPLMDDLTAIQSKPIQSSMDSIYTQFVSPMMGNQNTVPLNRSQTPIHSGIKSKSRGSGANDFAQTNNTSYSSVNINQMTQPFGVKSSPFKKKYVNQMTKSPVHSDADNQKFIVPKSLPIKQRPRERSISTPHININRDNSAIMAFPMMPTPSAVSLTDLPSTQSNYNVERSTSLPVYTQQRRRSVTSMQRNPTHTTSASSVNISYPSQQNFNKMQVIGQTAMDTQSISQYCSPHMVVNNPYDISQGSSSGSTLIARLLTSNSLNNISNESSQQMYSNVNQSAAQSMNIANSAGDGSTTIDASCIGIRGPVNTGAHEKPQFVFAPKFKEPNVSPISGQMAQNMKQNFVMQSNPNVCSPNPSLHPSPPLTKSRSSPVGMSSSPKESMFAAIHSIPSPPSLCSPIKTKPKTTKDRIQYKEHRRVCHINAEQKRRCNIKNGFESLRSLLPTISQNSNTKISKAAMLQKAAEHIRQLKNDRQSQQEEYDLLKQQVESLNQTIGVFQNQLPATGVPVSCQRSTQTREFYENYVRERTLQNWKFWIFSIIMESLWDSYNNTVSTSNGEEMSKTLFRWLEQNCCLIRLRKDVLNSLRFLSTSTNILTDPKSLPDEAVMAVTKKEKPLSS